MPCILENTHQTLSTTPLPGASTTLVENIPRASDGTGLYLTSVCEEDHTLMGNGVSAETVYCIVSEGKTRQPRTEAQSDTMNFGAQNAKSSQRGGDCRDYPAGGGRGGPCPGCKGDSAWAVGGDGGQWVGVAHLCPQKGANLRRAGHFQRSDYAARCRYYCGAARTGGQPERARRDRRHSHSVAVAGARGHQSSVRCHFPRQGRGRFTPVECGFFAGGAAGSRPLHPGGNY